MRSLLIRALVPLPAQEEVQGVHSSPVGWSADQGWLRLCWHPCRETGTADDGGLSGESVSQLRNRDHQ